MLQMYTDRQFLAPLSEAVTAMRALSSERPIFLYQVSHRGRHSITTFLHPGSRKDYGKY